MRFGNYTKPSRKTSPETSLPAEQQTRKSTTPFRKLASSSSNTANDATATTGAAAAASRRRSTSRSPVSSNEIREKTIAAAQRRLTGQNGSTTDVEKSEQRAPPSPNTNHPPQPMSSKSKNHDAAASSSAPPSEYQQYLLRKQQEQEEAQQAYLALQRQQKAQQQQQQFQNSKILAKLQTELQHWKQQRDTAQILFMQENSALERLQKSVLQTKARVEKKKWLIENFSSNEKGQAASENQSTTTTLVVVSDQSENALDENSNVNMNNNARNKKIETSMNSNVFGTRVKKRDATTQCDAALAAAADFATSIDICHNQNLAALRQMKAVAVDAVNEKNIRLAEEVADLVRRTQIIQKELLSQLERFKRERMSQHQTAIAKNLVFSTIIVDPSDRVLVDDDENDDDDRTHDFGNEDHGELMDHEEAIKNRLAMIADSGASNISVMMNYNAGKNNNHQYFDPHHQNESTTFGAKSTMEPKFLARDPSEAVYRTVERARLALSQTVVKF